MSKSGAVEEHPSGDVVWKVGGRTFASWCSQTGLVSVKSTLDQQAMLILHPAIGIANHSGRYGWISVAVYDDATLRLTRELIDASLEMVTRRKARKLSDARLLLA
jgi:predicted DNA-binding protein (MmcQ/YjbR family)